MRTDDPDLPRRPRALVARELRTGGLPMVRVVPTETTSAPPEVIDVCAATRLLVDRLNRHVAETVQRNPAALIPEKWFNNAEDLERLAQLHRAIGIGLADTHSKPGENKDSNDGQDASPAG